MIERDGTLRKDIHEELRKKAHEKARHSAELTVYDHWEATRKILAGETKEFTEQPASEHDTLAHDLLTKYFTAHSQNDHTAALLQGSRIAMRNEPSPVRMSIAITVWAEQHITDPIVADEISLLESFPLSQEEHIRPVIESYKQMRASEKHK